MTAVTANDLKLAIEGRDAGKLAGFYADDAVMRIIDRDHPPSAPLELRGKPAIAAFYDDVCGRAMSHRIDAAVADEARLAFSETCAYPDGTKVYCTAMLSLTGGMITEQTTVQAWDG